MQAPSRQHNPEIGRSPTPLRIRGRRDELVVYFDELEWPLALAHLDAYLQQSPDFFQGGHLSLDIGERLLALHQAEEVRYLLQCHAIQLGALYSSNLQSCQLAREIGLAAIHTTIPKKDGDGGNPGIQGISDDSKLLPSGGISRQSAEGVMGGDLLVEMGPPMFHQGGLRSGQVLRSVGPIVVIGDVNPGAQIISASHILVWGRLRGIAHAGVDGDEQATVGALDFEPTQLRIGFHVAVSPANQLGAVRRWFGRSQERGPEMARVAGDQIVVEPWQEAHRHTLNHWEPKVS